MPSTSSTQVLVVGAGPVGTMVGIELLRRGVPCRLIDRLSEPVATSRAFTLHARTLEVFALQGLAERFVARGLRSRGLDFRFMELGETARLDFTTLDSPFPYILIINQNVVEAVLRERFVELGGTVEWQTTLDSLVQDDAGIRATIAAADGTRETIEPRFVVGCDGLRSLVRTSIGIDFEGDSYTGQEMRMMDVPLSGWPLGDDAIHYLIVKDRMLLVTKLPGANYRLLISDRGDSHRSETARSDFQLLMDAYHPEVRLGEPEWATIFEIWRRVSTSYRRGSIFLCGDAAHIHSPAGGQGMNACLHDAFDLGWRLALVARGEAPAALLDGYERERRPIAQQVIQGSHLMHQVMMAHGTSVEERIKITQTPDYHRRTVRQVSGLAYTYRDPELATPGLVDGDRAPDARIDGAHRVHERIDGLYFTLLVFQRHAAGRAGIEALVRRAAERHGNRLRARIIAAPGLGVGTVPGAIVADGLEAHEAYGASDADVACLVRADGYVAAIRPLERADEIAAALDGMLLARVG